MNDTDTHAGAPAGPAIVALMGAPLAFLALVAVSHAPPMELAREAGSAALVATAALFVCSLASATLVFAERRGAALLALASLLALVPWALMAAGIVAGSHNIAEALAGVSLDARATISLAGTKELLSARVLGAAMTMGSATALGGALLGLAADRAGRREAAWGHAVAGWSALGLGALSLVALLEAAALRRGLDAMVVAAARDRPEFLARIVQEVGPLELLFLVVFVVVALVGVVGAAAAARAGGLPRVLPALLAALAFAGGELALGERVGAAVQSLPPWASHADFTPVPLVGDGTRADTPSCFALPATLRCRDTREMPYHALAGVIPDPREGEDALLVALDARVPGPALRQLALAAAEAGYPQLVVLGERSPPDLRSAPVPSYLRPHMRALTAATWWLPTMDPELVAERAPRVEVIADEDTASLFVARLDASHEEGTPVVVGELPRVAPASALDTSFGGLGAAPTGALEALARLGGTAELAPGGALPQPGAVAPGAPLDASTIQSVVRGGVSRARRCYEQGLRANPTLAGRVDVSFTITPAGTVTDVDTSGTLADPTVTRCIAGVVASLVFPADEAREPLTVRYPFVFQASP